MTSETTGEAPAHREPHFLMGPLVLLLVATAVMALVRQCQVGERRAVAELPAAERQELYRRELENARALCGQGRRADELEERCREATRFLAEFPECDAECRALYRDHQAVPTR